ncbi:LytTR family transcriptional regulator [Actibacterium sp. 188UL27-1]|nr:LytTR family transcriptional regulator [Actibacterium sp. 188UL27-1]
MDMRSRGIYWTSVIGAALLIVVVARTVIRHVFHDLDAPTLATADVVTFGLTFTPFLYVFTIWFTGLASSPMPGSVMFALVLLIAIGIRFLEFVLPRSGRKLPDRPTAPLAEEQTAPRLVARLPLGRRGALIRLSVRDHYVDVVTDLGDATLLMRFGDALAELEGADGLQVHRSHWVAVKAVDRLIRKKGRVLLVLIDGTEVPVSRPFLAQVRDRFTSPEPPQH